MAFELTSDITIGLYKNVKVNDVKITKSLFEYVDKAVIKIPTKARVKMVDEAGSPIVGSVVESAKLFEEGDKVLINLGYNGVLKNEFEGFISRLNFTTPLEIECEGYSYQLRKRSYKKTFKNTTLREILQFLVTGTDITLSPLIPSLKVNKILFNSETGTECLEKLKKELRDTIAIHFTGKELYAGLVYLNQDPIVKLDVKYQLGWNTIKDGDLKLRQAKNQEVIIRFKGKKADGTKVTASIGNKGEIKEISTHAITDQQAIRDIGQSLRNKLSYDGYEGKLTAFLVPYCEPRFRAILIDNKYPERSGNYLVESTEVRYGRSGARRIVGIGKKL